MEENNNQPYQSPQDNDDVLFCCKKLTTNQRKIGFYITLLIGGLLYITSIIYFFGSVFGSDTSYIYAICAAFITLLCPLWMNSPSQLISGLREPSRKKAMLILIISIIGLFITEIIMEVGCNYFKVYYLIVKIIATAIVMIFNFITRKIFLER